MILFDSLRRTLSRRDALKTLFFAGAAAAAGSQLLPARADSTPSPTPATPPASGTGPFTLPPLPYAYDALEPYIDAETMHLHHDRHHAKYVENLNAVIAQHPEMATQSVEDIMRGLGRAPDDIRIALKNNAGGHLNHSMFWLSMKKGGGGLPTGPLGDAITSQFKGFAGFQEQFNKEANGIFGSGWAWLSIEPPTGKLRIEHTPNQDNPLSAGRTPLLGLDVWEHAYYLKYHNVRKDYVNAFFNVVDWDAINGRYVAATKKA